MEYSLINLEKKEFSLSNSLAGVSYSAILPGKIDFHALKPRKDI